MDTPANQIPGFSYDAGTMNVGGAMAAGMEAGSKVGEQIGKGISDAANTFMQNRYADDTLAAMHQSGILSTDAYNAVAGKSLGAKQQMLGMYATQWINQQAQERELQKIGYTGAVQAEVAHKAFLDQYSLFKAQGKTPLPRDTGQGPAPRAQPVTPNLGGTPQNPTPLGSAGISNPVYNQPTPQGVTMGAPIGGKDQIPNHWQLSRGPNGQTGYMDKSGFRAVFHPFAPSLSSTGVPSQFGG